VLFLDKHYSLFWCGVSDEEVFVKHQIVCEDDEVEDHSGGDCVVKMLQHSAKGKSDKTSF
jgi:hypothetical protein